MARVEQSVRSVQLCCCVPKFSGRKNCPVLWHGLLEDFVKCAISLSSPSKETFKHWVCLWNEACKVTAIIKTNYYRTCRRKVLQCIEVTTSSTFLDFHHIYLSTCVCLFRLCGSGGLRFKHLCGGWKGTHKFLAWFPWWFFFLWWTSACVMLENTKYYSHHLW